MNIPKEPCLARSRSIRYLYIASGSAFLTTGVIGIFLPVLPTTPFILLAAICYARGSETFYSWIIHHRVFGRYIACYTGEQGVPLRHRLITILVLWIVIGITMILFVHSEMVLLFLILIAGAVSTGLFLMKPQPWKKRD